ncbi:MAG: hypothetical protein KAI57_01195 [Candidatus Pacebacteria bacterium]|nr:hypothetical protein [Candidatus Paceibacterota bacterium]
MSILLLIGDDIINNIKKRDKARVRKPKAKNFINWFFSLFRKDQRLKYFDKNQIYEVEEVSANHIWVKNDQLLKVHFLDNDPCIKITKKGSE